MREPLIERAIEISEKRNRILAAIRSAIKAGDKDAVFNLAKLLTGEVSDEAGGGTDSSLDSRAS